MTEPATIRPDGARILVARPNGAAGSGAGLGGLVDCTDAGAHPLAPGASDGCFIVIGTGAAPRPASGDGTPGPVALVASVDAAVALRGGGWTGPVVVEVPLDEQARARLAALRDLGELVGVVVRSGSSITNPAPGSRSTANGTDEVDPETDVRTRAETGRHRGRTIGLLTDALLSGVATIRTQDPVTARRARAVVAELTRPDQGAARMEP